MPPSRPSTESPQLVLVEAIDSTNAEAQRRAAAGERGPLWICARAQTRGRGRSGRGWISPEGSLAATLLFVPGAPAARLPGLALVAGVAACEAIAAAARETGSALPLSLKWPNDLLLAGAKAGGILVEASTYGTDLVALVGIGINIADAPAVEGRAATSLARHGLATTPDALAARLAATVAGWLARWDRGAGFAEVRSAWLERAGPPGAPITVNAGEGPVAGAFRGLDADGALLIDDAAGRRRRFTFGDVTMPGTEAHA
jgi:BirA family biotin operon repressor/biotin-[acetyl-CoA-carboxylase] ligase